MSNCRFLSFVAFDSLIIHVVIFCFWKPGQEDQTEAFDGEVKITPFNMEEEMEEGHFDKEGTYIFGKRDKDEVKDNWLDNIDWVKVTARPTTDQQAEEEEASGPGPSKFDSLSCYKEILSIIHPGETILKALKRIGGKKIETASERWKKKKSGASTDSDSSNKEELLKLTGLADSILTNAGNMDIYQETYEGIRYKIEKQSAPETPSAGETDMFGDIFDERTSATKHKSSGDGEGEPETKKQRKDKASEAGEDADVVQWQFKWENVEEAEIHGPHSTEEMQSWVDEGYFDSGVWVRRVGQPGEFHNSKRVDFELYL